MTAVTSRLKTLGRMDVAEKRRPQDGRLKTRTPEGQEVELRLSNLAQAQVSLMIKRRRFPSASNFSKSMYKIRIRRTMVGKLQVFKMFARRCWILEDLKSELGS